MSLKAIFLVLVVLVIAISPAMASSSLYGSIESLNNNAKYQVNVMLDNQDNLTAIQSSVTLVNATYQTLQTANQNLYTDRWFFTLSMKNQSLNPNVFSFIIYPDSSRSQFTLKFSQIVGVTNQSKKVNLSDFQIQVKPEQVYSDYDLNKDGQVDILDLIELANQI